mmetsp:Transcript_36374/g.94083  ORF Transcript_36374/g.94083 Transcript_36374/m.94083 type:complete len:212 (+) Transcript_36374:453-1088(+)
MPTLCSNTYSNTGVSTGAECTPPGCRTALSICMGCWGALMLANSVQVWLPPCWWRAAPSSVSCTRLMAPPPSWTSMARATERCLPTCPTRGGTPSAPSRAWDGTGAPSAMISSSTRRSPRFWVSGESATIAAIRGHCSLWMLGPAETMCTIPRSRDSTVSGTSGAPPGASPRAAWRQSCGARTMASMIGRGAQMRGIRNLSFRTTTCSSPS